METLKLHLMEKLKGILKPKDFEMEILTEKQTDSYWETQREKSMDFWMERPKEMLKQTEINLEK